MSNKHLPNEIFARIFDHFQRKASHRDMKNLQKALDHPELEGYQEAFDHFTSRSRQDKNEEGNFICPICVFSQKEIYDDSVWDDLCQTLFGSHFVLFGSHQLVKMRPKRVRPPSKRKSAGSDISKSYILQFIFAEEFWLKRSRKKPAIKKCPDDPFTVSYVTKIHYSKECEKVRETFSEHSISKLKIYNNVSDYIEHLNNCDSHYYRPSIKTKCDDDQSDVKYLNYDTFYKLKAQGQPIQDLSKPRNIMRKLTVDRNTCMSHLISLKQPDPKLFDGGSQNHDFLELVLWPILTFAISLQLEDHLSYPTTQFKTVPENLHALALRDLLRCICEVSENLEYDFEVHTWLKAKFAALHGMLEILDSFFPDY